MTKTTWELSREAKIALGGEEKSCKIRGEIREEERKQERKKERRRKRKSTMNYSKNSNKHMFLQDLLVLSLRRMKVEEKRKKK